MDPSPASDRIVPDPLQSGPKEKDVSSSSTTSAKKLFPMFSRYIKFAVGTSLILFPEPIEQTRLNCPSQMHKQLPALCSLVATFLRSRFSSPLRFQPRILFHQKPSIRFMIPRPSPQIPRAFLWMRILSARQRRHQSLEVLYRPISMQS